jgi:hypothetical protein
MVRLGKLPGDNKRSYVLVISMTLGSRVAVDVFRGKMLKQLHYITYAYDK